MFEDFKSESVFIRIKETLSFLLVKVGSFIHTILNSIFQFFRRKRVVQTTAGVLIVLTIIYSAGFLFTSKLLGASYVFNQSSWTGGEDGGATGIHPTNQSNWNKYSTKDASLTADTTLTLGQTALTVTDDGTLTTTGSATGGGFSNGTNSQTAVSGSGSGASVVLSSNSPYTLPLVAGGTDSGYVLKSDGTVWAWGYNFYGGLGDNTAISRYTPVQVSGLTGVTAIAAGNHSAYALKSDGTVWAWGDNNEGQIGDNSTTDRHTPVQVSGLTGVTAIAGGLNSAYALKSDGTVWAWGDNTEGQLGDNTTTNRLTPVQVSGLTGVTAITASFSSVISGSAYALKSDGTVWAWGSNGVGQLGDNSTTQRLTPVQVSGLTNVTAIAGGGNTAYAVKSNGTVWAWGKNNNGSLGDGTETQRLTPVQVSGLTGVTLVAGGRDNFAHALKSDGTVWSWGKNGNGQLGDNTTTNRLTPVQVSGLTNITTIGVGGFSAYALKSDGTVWSWGANSYGQLGDNSTTQRNTPVNVIFIDLVGFNVGTTGSEKIHSGFGFGTYVTKSDGTVWFWGNGTFTSTQVSSLIDIAAIGTGITATYALKLDGTVWATGNNSYGQLGDGTTTSSGIYVQVSGLTNIVAVVGGEYSAHALKSDGTVWAWGRNQAGQIGDNTTTDRHTPVQVSGLTNVIAVAEGYRSAYALKSDGTVWAWGGNVEGQLGDNSNNQSNISVQVSGLTNVTEIAAGNYSAYALKSDGTVWSWGSNINGQLGVGIETGTCGDPYYGFYSCQRLVDHRTPVQVSGLTNVTAIAGGGGNSAYALKSDGTVWSWGYNTNGQLGDNSTTQRDTPVQVSGLTGAIAVTAGTQHTCSIKSGGTVWCWGYNNQGTLGNATSIDSYVPTQTKIYLAPVNFNAGSAATYNTPGTFTSAVIDLATVGVLSTFSYNKTTPTNTTLTVDVRAGDTVTPDGTWTSWQTDVASGGSIAGLGSHRYVQYRANLATTDSGATPTLNDITIGYSGYPSSSTLTSSAYNSNDPTNAVGGVSWIEDNTLPTGTGVTVSIRTAGTSGGLTNESWVDFTNATNNCTKSSGTVTCTNSAIPSGLKDGTNDQWLQYKVTLTSTGGATPTVSGVSMTYVVNATPEFDATYGTNGVVVSQVSDSGSSDWGKVSISYKVRDPDTSAGSPGNQYKVIPSFSYNIGGGWVNITAPYLGATDLDAKAVDDSSYNTYTAVWDARTQIPDTYTATAQVRVTVSDGELANATRSATGDNFTLDTKAPTVTAFTADSSTDTLTLTASDDSLISYVISNNSDLSADGNNGTSGTYQNVGANSVTVTPSWILVGAPSYETVYSQVRDIYGNTTDRSTTVPATPSGVDIKDVSNVGSGIYREFISWDVFVATTSSYFNQYQVYRSDDNVTFSSLATVTSTTTNYYLDPTVASTTTYYYKMRVRDHNGNLSNYSATRNDTPNGQGGSDITPPAISSVNASPVQATWATITWTTDELSNSTVRYRIGNGAYTTVTSDSMVTSHSMTLPNLTSSTLYQYQVISVDPSLNSSTDDNGGNNFTFGTLSGPAISGVTTTNLGEQSATVTWNTTVPSDSYVYYSTSLTNIRNNTSLSQAGSASLVSGSNEAYPHSVTLPSLSENTTYYYYVKSTDASDNSVTDTNGTDFYTFTTTQDNIPPVISNIGTAIITSNSVVITWTTDELSDSQVEYGISSGSLDVTTTLQATSTINHAETISGLTPETVYYYKVKSRDTHANLATSLEQSFTTARAGETIIVYVSSGGGGGAPAVTTDTTKPVISNINVESIGAFNAVVSFETNEESTGITMVGKSVTFESGAVGSSIYATRHSVPLRGLSPNTQYFYQVEAIDKSGNLQIAEVRNFTTKFVAEALEDLKQLKDTENFQQGLENIIESTTPSLIPPIIQDVKVNELTSSGATISWKTNVPSYSGLAYSTDADYKKSNTYVTEVGQTEKKTTSHTIKLTELSPSTIYRYEASLIR